MLTAKINEADRLKGFEIGADDYVCKPFSPREVIARIKSVLRRTENTSSNVSHGSEEPVCKDRESDISIDENALTATLMGQPLDLTFSELSLLRSFVNHPNRVFERSQLLDMLKQQGNDCTDRAVDSHIKNLRRKLRKIAPDQNIIQSVYGVGYKFVYPVV